MQEYKLDKTRLKANVNVQISFKNLSFFSFIKMLITMPVTIYLTHLQQQPTQNFTALGYSIVTISTEVQHVILCGELYFIAFCV